MRIHGIDVSATSDSSSSGSPNAITTVAPVVREILRNEVHLARALQLEQLRFAHDVRRARTSDACRA